MLITAECASVVYVCIFCTCSSSRVEYNSLIVGPGVWGVRGSEQTFGCTSVDDNWDGFSVYSVVQVGSGVRLG